jgi:hypothetical protein
VVAALAEADELVVLADDVGGALGEVEREGGLAGAEVVDVEDEVLGEVFVGAPDDPADAGVDEAILQRAALLVVLYFWKILTGGVCVRR